MSKVILAEQIRDSFTQEQADQRYLSKEGDIANGDITLNIADGRKAFSIADLDAGTYAYLASDNSQAELSLMSLQLTSNSNEASINSSTDININSYSHEVNLNGSSINVPEPTTNASAVPKSYVDSNFVSQESGKGLSTNDFTTEEKNKLAGIADNANNYILPMASANTLGGIKVGNGLNISDGVLSSNSQTYTAGDGISISGNVISAVQYYSSTGKTYKPVCHSSYGNTNSSFSYTQTAIYPEATFRGIFYVTALDTGDTLCVGIDFEHQNTTSVRVDSPNRDIYCNLSKAIPAIIMNVSSSATKRFTYGLIGFLDE